MPDGAPESVLERKAQAQRRAMGMGTVSVSRALARSLSIASDALWSLGLSCAAVEDDTMSADRALCFFDEAQLFLVLETPEGNKALVGMDRTIVTGLIEVQTLGKVTGFPLDDRPFTPTDAAMMAPLIDAALPRFVSILAGRPEHDHLQGYEFGAQVEDLQTAGLVFDAAFARLLAFDISLAQDTRRGRIVFLFPEPDTEQNADGAGRKAGKYEDAMMLVPTRMQAILTRIHLPLSKAQALRPGDVLDISPNAMTSATLVVDGGHVAATGKLGQMNGFRAVRIGGEKALLHQPIIPPNAEEPPAQQPAANVETVSSAAPPDLMTQPANLPAEVEPNMTIGTDPADLL